MRIPARLLLISLAAMGLYFSPSRSIRAQKGDTVNVRPRVAASQPGMPEVKASADRNRVPLGDEVTFTLSPAHVLMDSRYQVTLFFGDGARELMRQPRIIHLYARPGNYTYSILVEPASQPKPTPTPSLAIPTVTLTAVPTSVEVNQRVNFAAQLSHRYPDIRFRFVFGDGSPTAWQTEVKSTHAYRPAGTYQAYVDIGISANGSVKPVGGSKRELIQVTEPSLAANITVKLSASATSVKAATPVTFVARVISPQSNVKYRFDFGDQSKPTDWQVNARTQHRYSSVGKYSVRVDVRGMAVSGAPQLANDSVTVDVTSSDVVPAVDLNVIPGSVPLGVPVFFQAIPSVANSQARYRFSFGDRSTPSVWSAELDQTHTYTSVGTYPVFVEMSASGNEPINAVAVSANRRVRVTPIGAIDNTNGNTNSNTSANANSNTATNANANANGNANSSVNGNANGNANSSVNGNTNANSNSNLNGNANANANSTTAGNVNSNAANNSSPSPSASETPLPGPTKTDWWKYVIIAAIILFAGYQAASYMFAPRPTFVPKFDPGNSRVGADKPLAFDLEMDVDPNISGGEVKLDTQGNSFIKSERTE